MLKRKQKGNMLYCDWLAIFVLTNQLAAFFNHINIMVLLSPTHTFIGFQQQNDNDGKKPFLLQICP